jgi:hypothetical protein
MSNNPTRIQPAYDATPAPNGAIERHAPAGHAITHVSREVRTVGDLEAHQSLLEDIKNRLMRAGEHYSHHAFGGIAADKPSLLLPGAQLIATALDLSVAYEDGGTGIQSGVFFSRKRCVLSGGSLGSRRVEGVGSANSQEGVHRKKTPFDAANMIEKMACKRAFVAAVLMASSGAKIFTQDLEDMSDATPLPPQLHTHAPVPSLPTLTHMEAEWELLSGNLPPEKIPACDAALGAAKADSQAKYRALLGKFIARAKNY